MGSNGMKLLNDIAKEQADISTIVEISGIFEGIAGMRIAQVKNQVLRAQEFFNSLWQIYTQIRVDSKFRFGRGETEDTINKELLIVITAEGSLSGDIDQKLITYMRQNFDPAKNDIIVIGHHGAIQLAAAGIAFKKYFKMPEKDENINTAPLIREVQSYKTTTVYYQTYVSLMTQDVKHIALSSAVQQKGQDVAGGAEVISEDTYIFEPSTYAVVNHLESSMLQIALSEVILESKLAQYASRFKAMSLSHSKAEDSLADLRIFYNRAKRAVKDERLKEIVNSLRKPEVQL